MIFSLCSGRERERERDAEEIQTPSLLTKTADCDNILWGASLQAKIYCPSIQSTDSEQSLSRPLTKQGPFNSSKKEKKKKAGLDLYAVLCNSEDSLRRISGKLLITLISNGSISVVLRIHSKGDFYVFDLSLNFNERA